MGNDPSDPDIFAEMFGQLWEKTRDPQRHPMLETAAQFFKYALLHRHETKSQLLQDLFVLFVLNQKRSGYFVEIGATDGIELSNTFLLETTYGWDGIVVEPAKVWHPRLRANRKAAIDVRYVGAETGPSIDFVETVKPFFSTTPGLVGSGQSYAAAATYKVDSVSLNDLLADHRAPADIDYISIDTEGSEPQILEAFDFSRHRVSVITVEHNHVKENQERIGKVLSRHGYSRVLAPLTFWDDWYLHQSLLRAG